MSLAIVVNDPSEWAFDIPGVEVIAARAYLTDPVYSRARNLKVFNLCRHYRYQATGYYVTLLAEARGHRPQPGISAIQDFRVASIARETSEDLSEIIQESLGRIRSKTFVLSIYFGRNMAERYARLSLRLFNVYPAPLLRAQFKHEDGQWQLEKVAPIPASEIPDSHRQFVTEAASRFFERGRWSTARPKRHRYDMAILHHPEATSRPSNDGALKRFIKAADRVGIQAELITKNDFGLLGEYDALFIRETTAVNHHTYRFARRAEANGMAVMDDPLSIVRCANKVYLSELLERVGVPGPKTIVAHKDNLEQVCAQIGFPCVLKQPDSSFSQGVIKVKDRAELEAACETMLQRSDLIIAQEFTPSEFDWRIAILENQVLFCAKYHMAPKHWQIVKKAGDDYDYGKVEAISVYDVPKAVIKAALKAAEPIGDGLYGVDIKVIDGRVLVMEVNDNPNVDHGYDDTLMGDEIYDRIMRSFLTRIERLKEGRHTA